MKVNTRKILFADDHVIIRRGLKILLDNNFGKSNWFEVDRTMDVLQALETNEFTHIILDIQLLDNSILDIIADIRNNYPKLPIMIYTMCNEDIYAPRMYNLGINGFLSKQCTEIITISAFNDFFKNQNYYSNYVLEKLICVDKTQKNPIQKLSKREFSVLQHLVKGLTLNEMCVLLNLKKTTVATYKARIMEKTGAENIVDLVRLMDVYANTK
jgi:DNA-binding NarL/FixJ family response regulator